MARYAVTAVVDFVTESGYAAGHVEALSTESACSVAVERGLVRADQMFYVLEEESCQLN